MTCEQLKAHPVSLFTLFEHCGKLTDQFFYGVDWTTIRDIDAPFVPHLKSITDTSYFPTDEIDQSAADQGGADDSTDAKKDLAFLGYTSVVSVCTIRVEANVSGSDDTKCCERVKREKRLKRRIAGNECGTSCQFTHMKTIPCMLVTT